MIDKTGFIDIHIHILPGLDDGAQSMNEALSMLQVIAEQGAIGMIVTPHYKPGSFIAGQEIYENTLKQFQDRAFEIYPEMHIYGGNEIYFHEGILEALEKGDCKTLAGSDYVLIEFSPSIHFSSICRAVDILECEGYRPVLAHVEHYAALVKEADRIWELIDRGALIQVDAQSVEKMRGGRFIRRIFKEEAVHFVCTDAHDMLRRPPIMDKCRRILKKWCSENYIDQILRRNQIKLLQNLYIE